MSASQRHLGARLLMLAAAATCWLAVRPALSAEGGDWQAQFKTRIAELRAQGQPVTFAEALARRPHIPDDRNSALVFLRAFDNLAAADAGESEGVVEDLANATPLGAQHSEVGHQLIGRWLQMNAQALVLIHEGAKLPSGAYPIQAADNPFAILLPHLASLRKAARLTAMDAVYRAEAGDASGAADDLFAARRLCASIGDGPILIDCLVRIAAEGLVTRALERSLGLCEMLPDRLAALRDEVRREQNELSFTSAFVNERAGVLYVLAERPDLMKETLQDAAEPAPPGALAADALARNGLYYCGVMEDAIRISALAPRRKLAEGRKWAGDAMPGLGANQPDRWFVELLIPAIGMVLQREVKAQASLHVAHAALAVERWRMAHPPGKEWPASLDQLVPEYLEAVPEDSFSDTTLLYRRTDDGVVVYSVGPDGKDDGGAADDASQAPNGTDLAFHLFNPELRRARRLTADEEAFYGGRDLLHIAAQLGDKEAVERLLADGADGNAVDRDGRTAAAVAVAAGHRDVADVLRRHGGLE